MERLVWKTLKYRMPPMDPRFQRCFKMVVDQVELAPVVQEAAESWVFGDNVREECRLIQKRSMAMFRFLAVRSYLELFLRSVDGNVEAKAAVERLIELTTRDVVGSSLAGKNLQEDLDDLDKLPDTIQTERIVMANILTDLDESKVRYIPEEKMCPFVGKV